ncbi:MAG: putative metal-binding motif-containing protein [Sandaracinaceae bacterium]|nr:putative metal-binding motif-containing protein [Sandaracinaceae bacterium]
MYPDLGDCDRDNDGVAAVACGGADCDDGDPERFAGNRERCAGLLGDGRSAADHDEDCDPCTVTGRGIDGDNDGDFYLSTSCTNSWMEGNPPSGCDPNYTFVDSAYQERYRGRTATMGTATFIPIRPRCVGTTSTTIADGDSDVGVLFRDLDHDGRGDPTTTRTGDCAIGWVTNSDDCDDTTPWTYVGAAEVCDNRDNDCSLPGTLGGGFEVEDGDGDGAVGALATCIARGEPGVLPFWPVMPRTDCDDDDPDVGPHGVETCGNAVDDATMAWWTTRCRAGAATATVGGAGSANDRIAIVNCVPVPGYVPDCGDCDDTNPTRYPETPVVRRVDNNCDFMSPLAEDVDLGRHSSPNSPCVGSEASGAPAGVYPRTVQRRRAEHLPRRSRAV